MEYSDFGSLTVRAYKAGGAIPLPAQHIKIYGADEENRFVVYTALTDADGVAPRFSLPAPALMYSLLPNGAEASYANYNLEIGGDGYYSKTIFGIPIFSGIDAIQDIAMIPLSGMNAPVDNLKVYITENEKL